MSPCARLKFVTSTSRIPNERGEAAADYHPRIFHFISLFGAVTHHFASSPFAVGISAFVAEVAVDPVPTVTAPDVEDEEEG